ncbi:hypothetical protein [uncultured Nitratireductor sp.]|uniref:hypothetical protein n=1 Tax=uncultured Nitratireductor sp. TaxID=520953 RepID=UPI0025E97556|nr:hypothetical protein [uncultured Nitratireductor sp.]
MMMSLDNDRPARAMVRPDDLTPGQRKALATVRDFKLTRVKGGWRGAGSPKVTLPTASYLGFKRLVMRANYRGRPRLVITQEGRNLLDIAESRGRA